MTKILFVCTANRFRSPLAAYYFQNLLEKDEHAEDIVVESAGTWTRDGLPATGDAQELAATMGISLSQHRSREVTNPILQSADLILVMETGQKEAIVHEFPSTKDRIFLLSEVVTKVEFDIADPYMTEESPERIAKEIFQLIKKGYDRIIKFAIESARNKSE